MRNLAKAPTDIVQAESARQFELLRKRLRQVGEAVIRPGSDGVLVVVDLHVGSVQGGLTVKSLVKTVHEVEGREVEVWHESIVTYVVHNVQSSQSHLGV